MDPLGIAMHTLYNALCSKGGHHLFFFFNKRRNYFFYADILTYMTKNFIKKDFLYLGITFVVGFFLLYKTREKNLYLLSYNLCCKV